MKEGDLMPAKAKGLEEKCSNCKKILENFNSTRSSREHGRCSACYCGSGIPIHPDTDVEKDITQELT